MPVELQIAAVGVHFTSSRYGLDPRRSIFPWTRPRIPAKSIHGARYRPCGYSVPSRPIGLAKKNTTNLNPHTSSNFSNFTFFLFLRIGFLSFDTDDVPGNAGMFDQIEALRWVNKHVEYFGGDPNEITIAGQSAGSASISLLLLAPQAKG